MERRSGIDPDRTDVDLGEALQYVRRSYEKTWRLLRRAVKRFDIPFDLNAPLDPEIEAAEARLRHALDRDPVSVDARRYFSLVQEWFTLERAWFDGRLGAIEQAVGAGEDPTLHAERALDLYEQVLVIRQYEGFVGAKVRRALGGLARYDPEIEDRVQNDANGSAKVALLAIERSVNAWRSLAEHHVDASESIGLMVAHLESVRERVECRFPSAREFVRPGFDTAHVSRTEGR